MTAEKTREAKLAERNRFWTASRDLHVILGLDGRHRELNPAWRTELGHDPEALIGVEFVELVRPDQRSDARQRLVSVLEGERLDDFEIALRAADGSYRWYSLTAFTESDAVLITGRDVTEKKRREAELHTTGESLRQSQKLDMIGQLTGGIAHDFNNLLTAVQSNLELLDSTLAPDDLPARALVGDALAGAVRGAALTQRLLAFACKQELAPSSIDVGRLIEGMKDLLVHSLGPRIRIDTSVAKGTPPASVDGNQLEMALLNLAVNARDAMEGAGSLSFAIELAEVHQVGLLPAGNYVRITVSDTGQGMDATTLEKAAEPFFTTKAVGSGTGLGLSMIHGLAEQSGGRFRLTSEPGVGSVAELLLPMASGPADFPAPPDTPKPMELAGSEKCRRVLVVDDDALVLNAMAATLKKLGHEVLTAESGTHALQTLARERAVDVVITDHLMPGMSGLELSAAVRRDHVGTAVILATGYVEVAQIEAGLIDARLVKPFRMAHLKNVLAGVFR